MGMVARCPGARIGSSRYSVRAARSSRSKASTGPARPRSAAGLARRCPADRARCCASPAASSCPSASARWSRTRRWRSTRAPRRSSTRPRAPSWWRRWCARCSTPARLGPARPLRRLVAGLPGRRARARRRGGPRDQRLRHRRAAPRPHAAAAHRPGRGPRAPGRPRRGARSPRARGRRLLRRDRARLRRPRRRRARALPRARRVGGARRGAQRGAGGDRRVSFVHELRVRYGECDPQGIVFNANYLLYFDVAFTEYWRERDRPLGRHGRSSGSMRSWPRRTCASAPPRASTTSWRSRSRPRSSARRRSTTRDRRPPRRGAARRVPAAPRVRRPRELVEDRHAAGIREKLAAQAS